MKFRKKPVVVEAVKFDGTDQSFSMLKDFAGSAIGGVAKNSAGYLEVAIRTLEDGEHLTVQHIATEGDWIIKGVQGEFYPCKPDIFEQTYEVVIDEE